MPTSAATLTRRLFVERLDDDQDPLSLLRELRWSIRSFVRGAKERGSDRDVLLELERVPGLLRLLELEMELSTLLGLPVDLAQKEALKPAIGRRILQDVMPL